MLRRYRLLALLLFSALLSATLPPTSVLFAASGSASPMQAQPGMRVHFDASGFTPGERIDLWVTAPSAASEPRYPSVNADSVGNAVWSWDVTANAEPGRWTMSARGSVSDQTLGIPFEVVNSVAAATISVTPERGGRGTLFQFSASGFNANEPMDAWITGPDGVGIDLQKPGDQKPTADEQGVYRWSWTAPGDAIGGTYSVHTRGVQNRKQYNANFVVDVPPELGPASSVSPAEGRPARCSPGLALALKATSRSPPGLTPPTAAVSIAVHGYLPMSWHDHLAVYNHAAGAIRALAGRQPGLRDAAAAHCRIHRQRR
ncbi:hypothetical protein HC891_13390 [Candidatus Gracilibacteria bacterium]|nr:hypothetical protein [Candidatus Gracilibacteria bacterium]